jgi:ligand-binding sensor domain-containing protein
LTVRIPARRAALLTAALATSLLIAQPVAGLDPSRRLTQYTVETWGTEDGLPSMAIAAAVQTPDGDLWLGTGDGLVRFDGVRFEAFDRQTPGLRGTEVRALYVDGRGRLWIGFAFGGISRREGDGFVAVGPENLVIGSFVEGPDGLLAGTATGVVRVEAAAVEPYTPAASLPPLPSRLMRDREGRIWVSAPSSMYAFDGREVLFHDTGGDALAAASVGIDARGDAIRWRSGRLERWVGDGFVPAAGFTLPPRVDPPQLYTADSAGAVWLAFGQITGIGRWLDGRVETLPTNHPAVAGRFAPLCEDREGNLWLGSWTAGLMRLSDGPLTSWSTDEGLPGETVRALHEAADGAIWAGTIHGLARLPLAGESAQVYPVPDDGRGFMQSDFVYSLAPLADGALAVGTQRGLFRFADGRIEPWLPDGRVFPRQVFSLTTARDGALWIGSAVGDVPLPGEGSPLVRLVAGRAEDVPIPAVIVFQTLEDRRGHIWVSTSNGMFEVPPGRPPQLHPIPGMTAQPYYLASTEDSRGDLWFATIQDGIVRVRNGEMRRLGRPDGLPDDGFTALVDDGLGYLWLGSAKGLLRIAFADLDAKLADLGALLPYRRFDRDDGLKSPSIEGGNDGNVLRARDGRLWFATLAGAAVVDPGQLPPVARPAARVERVLVDGKALPGLGDVRLAPGRYRLELELTAIHMKAPKRLRFRHRLSGVDADWIDAGSRRFASYPLVPPGERTFAVEASVDGETWGPLAELAVVIAPHWWQRTWFLVVAPLALVGLMLGAQRARVARLRRRAQELERMVDFGRGVTGLLDPEEIGQQLLRALAVRFGEGPRLLLALREGRPSWMAAAGWPGPAPRPAVSYEGMAGWRRPLVLAGAEPSGLAPWLAELRAAGLGFVAPLISGETTFGLIGVAGERAKDADLAQLGALAAQVTMALEGAWQAQEAVRWQHVSEARREWLETDLVARLVFAAVVRIGGDATPESVTGALAAAVGEDAVLTPGRVSEALRRLIDRGAVVAGAEGTLRVARDRWLLLPEIRQPLAEIARQAVLRLGAYRLGERIGGGGMGEVFRGVNVHDGTLAAVKVLFPHQTVDAESRRRLAREGELVAAIRHPNVVRLLERGEHDGRLYLAMELLAGETLAARLSSGALGVDEAVRAGRQLASALAALHARDVVHRDLTASNVMCEPDCRYVLLDFGLARGLDSSTVTRGLTVLGTLPYMSPEQLRGEDVDPRTDLWSLGVVLHEMATGALPWEAAVTVRMALEILGEARPALRRLDGLPSDFAALVAALLEPDRACRLADAPEAERRLAALATASGLLPD